MLRKIANKVALWMLKRIHRYIVNTYHIMSTEGLITGGQKMCEYGFKLLRLAGADSDSEIRQIGYDAITIGLNMTELAYIRWGVGPALNVQRLLTTKETN